MNQLILSFSMFVQLMRNKLNHTRNSLQGNNVYLIQLEKWNKLQFSSSKHLLLLTWTVCACCVDIVTDTYYSSRVPILHFCQFSTHIFASGISFSPPWIISDIQCIREKRFFAVPLFFPALNWNRVLPQIILSSITSLHLYVSICTYYP